MVLSVNDVVWRYCGYCCSRTFRAGLKSFFKCSSSLACCSIPSYELLLFLFFSPLTCMSGCRYHSDDCCVAPSPRLSSSLGPCDAQCWKIRVEHIGGDELVCAWWVLHRRRGSAWFRVSVSCFDTGVQWWLWQIWAFFLLFSIFIVVPHRVVQWVLQASVARHLGQHFPPVSDF